MTVDKPHFVAGPPKSKSAVRSKRKEVAVIWKKVGKTGEEYLNIKINVDNGDPIWLNAFLNKQKHGEESRPDYIAFERDENA